MPKLWAPSRWRHNCLPLTEVCDPPSVAIFHCYVLVWSRSRLWLRCKWSKPASRWLKMAKTLYVRGCHNRQDREQDRRYFSTLSVAINDNNNNNNVFFSVPFLLWSTKPLLISPLTARVVRAPQMISQAVSSIFSLFSTALWDFANSRPVHSVRLSSHFFFCLPCLLLRFHCALQDGFGQTWWTGDKKEINE